MASYGQRTVTAIIEAQKQIAAGRVLPLGAGFIMRRPGGNSYEVARDGSHEGCPAMANDVVCWHSAAAGILVAAA